ncbi:hypothetical protein phiPsa267_090 [Pseudomonas phage phiPsa267]|uniref:Uncharacterized protein n=8 Tax=Otagovirus TaxID=2560197 RepID=A0A7G9V142_9CAUD|nr:holin [Pseudomonas phage phiPsa374]YP_010766818.1 hypothetical protein QGX14_gp143 [Pseudomonas phage psageK4]YP_010767007.1 hypothetical protein QGX15_gp145 [Pseudomonas phage psageK4e]YP_010767179.1 hypothetical protein QGX16_gp136 [Pseudomonas phage phiPsa397]YP_010767349.1 hypothetical protein QGX17_gp138 [Pseudomonas phage phiPsa381]YP_010767525.1 hypothetical protein QGX18_gp139 [Pseudomonas phage phiPsa347]YP_010767700.1 hypothetical protein QGX19_gp140 [Pseudomonas phage phiPsa267]
MAKKKHITLGVVAAIFLAAEPLMMLWQPLLPQGSYAGIATFVAVVRAGLVYYTTAEKEEGEEDADNN